ncbi:unnamed protein product [Arctia plantaginis]|uniref:MICOS complex subunit MIC60 n=1 Tax=Arctia plantaginis TaxID=874455 RepID=A0A8S1BID1_ARCPL|nr:unnamed protein product [Arctia plantaginis]
MLRVATYAFSVRSILSRRHPIDCHVASFTRFPIHNAIYNPRQREACPLPPPPPPKPPKDDSLLWGTVTILVLAGAGIVTAKSSPEVRDWLTLYAPWVDDLIAILYEENMTYGEFTNKCIEDMQKYIDSFSEEKDKPKPCSLDGKKPKSIPAAPAAPKGSGDDDEEDDSLTCEPEPPPVVTQGICDIERCFKDLGQFVDNNYFSAKEACRYYNGLVDETMEDFSYISLKKLHDAKREREDIVTESLKNACDAINRLEEMTRYLDCGVQASKDEIENAKLLFRNYKTQYTASRIQYEWENDKALARDRQWQIVESLVDKYTSENLALYSGLKYTDKRPHIQGDPDILLYSTLRYVKKLDEELKVASASFSDRVNRAYNGLPKGQQVEQNRKAQLTAAVAKRRAEVDKNFKDMAERQKQRNDKLLKKLLQEQSARHEAALDEKLAEKEKEISAKFKKMVTDKVRAEKNNFDNQLADMSKKLAVVEDKLNARLKVERETRRSQELWAAAASLLAATKKGDPYINVNKELNAIEKASEGQDKLVLTVLKSIPSSVRDKGLVPESVLKEKYKEMERIAMKVSLVEEDGGPMPVYILSWLQSILLFMKIPGIPQEEFEKPPKEPSKELDTFDLLRRARFWMERGNLAIALRYVNHLQGSRSCAGACCCNGFAIHMNYTENFSLPSDFI